MGDDAKEVKNRDAGGGLKWFYVFKVPLSKIFASRC
jgi:hypothetical protein